MRMPDFVRRGVETLRPGARERREAEETRIRRFKDRRASDLRWLMSQPQGRRIVAKLMADGKLLDKAQTAEQTAVRNHLVDFAGELIGIDREAWLLMLDEAWVDAEHAKNAS